MTRLGRTLGRRAKSFWRSARGSATIEFVILFPPFILIFMSSVESGLMMYRNVMLERAVDGAVRDLRIGTPSPPSYMEFKTSICGGMLGAPNCMRDLEVMLDPVPIDNMDPAINAASPLGKSIRCVDRANLIQPPDDEDEDPDWFENGGNNEMMLVSACLNVDPIFEHVGLGAILDRDPSDADNPDTNGYFIRVSSAFVNEPSR